jgi:hypothetical protein
MKFGKLTDLPWYTLLFSLYPPLFLLAHNLGQINKNTAYRSLAIGFFSVFLFFVLLSFLLKDFQKAGAILILFELLFFSYGHVYTFIKNVELFGIVIGRHRYLGLFWLGLMIFGLIRIQKHRPTAAFTQNLNIVVLALLIFPVIQIINFERVNAGYERERFSEPAQKNDFQPAENLPDVYYIILDAYGRSDVLEKNFAYDNTPFIQKLEDLGFYVAKCSQSNYSKTDLSLASSLNLNYLDVLDNTLTPENTDRTPLWSMVKHSLAAEKFRALGYQIYSFETGFDFTQIEPVDTFYVTPHEGFNDFEVLLLKTTAVVILDDLGTFQRFHLNADDYKYNRILFTLDTLKEKTPTSKPKYVFVHLLIPHQPFVFGADGEKQIVQKFSSNHGEYYSDKNYAEGYKNQTIFISKRLPEVLESIIRNSEIPPIIIVQGDHGPSHFSDEDRMAILNAYYFPQHNAELYASITPVNSFRLLFNTYFGEDYSLLSDISYYSNYPNPYQYKIIPNECNE